MFKAVEKDIFLHSEFFFKRFFYLIILFYFFSVFFPGFFLENSYFVITHDFYKENFDNSSSEYTEVYFPIDTFVKFLTLSFNTLFFLIFLLFIFLLKKKKFIFQFNKKKIIYFYFITSFIVIILSIFSLYFKNQLINSIYIFSILISNICFYFTLNTKYKNISILIFILNFLFCGIFRGIIIDGGVFFVLIFFVFFILFNNLSKKIIFLLFLSLPILFSFFYFFKITLMINKNNLNLLKDSLSNDRIQIYNCDKYLVQKNSIPDLCSKPNIIKQYDYYSKLANSLGFSNFELDEILKIRIYNKEISGTKQYIISPRLSKERNNFLYNEKLKENYFLYNFATIINKIIFRFDLNYNFYRVITFHSEYPDIVEFSKGESYRPLKSKLIPRKFLSDKPKENYGNIFGKKYGVISDSNNETTINLGFLLEGYVNYGYKGLIIPYSFLILFLSSFYFLFKAISKNSSKFIDYQIIILSMFTQLIFFIIITETNLSLIIGRFLYLNIILLIFAVAEKYIFKIIKNVQ